MTTDTKRFLHNACTWNKALELLAQDGGYWFRWDNSVWIKGPARWSNTKECVYDVRSYAEHEAATAPPKPRYRGFKTIDEVPVNRNAQGLEDKEQVTRGPVGATLLPSGKLQMEINGWGITPERALTHFHFLDENGKLTDEPLGVKVKMEEDQEQQGSE